MNTIVVGTDFSPQAGKAMTWAAGMADRLSAQLHVVHIHDSLLTSGNVAESVIEEAEVKLAGELAEQVTQMLGDRPVEQAIRRGPASITLPAYAEEVGAELIVVGTLGRSGIADLLFGSVAQGVVKNSKIPVVCVP